MSGLEDSMAQADHGAAGTLVEVQFSIAARTLVGLGNEIDARQSSVFGRYDPSDLRG